MACKGDWLAAAKGQNQPTMAPVPLAAHALAHDIALATNNPRDFVSSTWA